MSEFNLDEGHISLSGVAEVRHRALFFSTALGIACSTLIKDYIEYCREKGRSEGAAGVESIEHDGIEFGLAVKELLCVSIWLTLLEQDNGRVPDWLKNFSLEAMADADRLYAEPPAKQVMESYDIAAGAESLCDAVSFTFCTKLNLGQSSSDALIHLGQLLRGEKGTRANLLATSLRASLDQLDEKIATM